MSITFPMWFIYFWAVTIVLNFVKAITSFSKVNKELKEMPGRIAKLISPEIAESLGDTLSVKLNSRLSDEYIIAKRPVRKAKKEEAENA